MLHLNSIKLQNTGVYDDVDFKIEPGVSVIYGLNKTNSKKGSNANGAGKSFLWSMFKETLYEEPIIGTKQDTIKAGTRILDLNIGDRKVKVERRNNQLFVESRLDGKVFRSKGKSPAKAWLAKNNPINEEEFDTYVHLDSRVPHPLVMGTTAQRRAFFNSFFALDRLDIERKLFIAEYDKIKRSKAQYAEVLNEYTTLKKEANISELGGKLEEYRELQAELSGLTEKNHKLQEVVRLVEFETRMLPYIEKVRRISNGEQITRDWFEDVLKTTKWNLKHNTEGLNQALAWEQYKRDNAAYLEAFGKLSSQTRKLISKYGESDAYDKARAKSKERTRLLDSYTAMKSRLAKLDGYEKPSKPRSEKCEEDAGALISEYKVLKHKLEHAEKFNKGVCGECGQEVSIVSPKKLRARISEVEAMLDSIEEYDAYDKTLADYKSVMQEFVELKKEAAETKEKLESLKPYTTCYSELRDLPSKPSTFEGKQYEIKVKQQMVDEDKERIQLLTLIEPSIDLLVELESLSPKHRKLASKASVLQKRINEKQERVSKLHGELSAGKIIKGNLRRLKARLEELKLELKNEEYLSLLIEAYSDKAIKKMAIQAISDRLMKIINQYSKVVFPEDYSFEFNWDTSQLAFLVHRKIGRKKKLLTSDVRKLSGAESKLFTLILVLALLTFVPHRKRCNVIILDEPSANMSAETTKAFQDLIPIINKVVPSVIIITPKSNEVYKDAQAYTVIKNKGVATIVKGFPHEN